MPGKIIPVTSASHFETLINSSTYTIVDFYADWCGPCKAIAPVFQTLAEKETKPGKLQFVKVDVDAQQEVAKKYGVSAYVHFFWMKRRHLAGMPTFLVIKSKSVIETIRGANPSALTAAVRKASNDTGAGGAGSAAFASKGRTLGSANQPVRTVGEGPLAGLQRLMTGNGGFTDMAIRFVALYLLPIRTPNRKRVKWGKGPETDVGAHRRFKEDRLTRISAQGALWRVSDNAEALLERWPRKARLLMNRVVDSDNDTPLALLMSDFGKQRRFNSVWSSMICFLLYCTEENGALKRMGLELSEEQEDDLLDIAVVMSFQGYPRPGDDGDGSPVDHAMHAYIMTLLTDRDATPSTNPLLWWVIVLVRSSIEDGPEDFISRGHFARNILPMDLDIAQRLEGIEHFAKVFLLDLAFNTWDPADKEQLLSVQEDLNAADNSWLGERSSIRPAERETDKLKCTSPAWKSMLLHLEHTFAKHTKTPQGAALHPILTLRQELRALR
ncbi:hypothetical protein SLS59_009853 [Nothophoma quercina]|uniref:Thioredoxin domain-containing protein n=1 Tax=Nothophoma quercina TaxID=749835 RepID=A0ABR3QK47_9PLEO